MIQIALLLDLLPIEFGLACGSRLDAVVGYCLQIVFLAS